MARYVRAPVKTKAFYELWDNEGGSPTSVQVCDHEAVDTGLIDADGTPIMRLPNLIGFGREDDC